MRNRVGLRKTDWYRVRFQHAERGLTFGIARMFGDEAPPFAENGQVLVEHAILPIRPFVVPEADLTDCPLDHSRRGTHLADLGITRWGADPFDDYVALEQLAHEVRAERNPDDGKVHIDDLFSIGIADGSAHYVVTAVKGRHCTVEWRGFCPDRYVDHHFGWGRKAPTADVVRYVGRPAGLRRRFGKKDIDKPRRFAELIAEYAATHGFGPNVRP